MNIKVKYFASLAQMRGREEEELSLEAEHTAMMLYELLKKEHAFTFSLENVRVAINHEYKDFSTRLQDNDLVVFIPPVSGG